MGGGSKERPSATAEEPHLEDDDDSTPSSGFGVIVERCSHSTYYVTEVWAGTTVAGSRMHNAVAESQPGPHRESPPPTLVST